MKEKSGHPIFWGLMLVVAIVGVIAMSMSHSGKLNIAVNKSDESSYKNIQELNSNYGNKLNLPKAVFSDKDLKITTSAGQFVQIVGSNYVIKFGPFVANKADPLGFYNENGEPETEVQYNVKNPNSSITYLRYRLGYPEYTNCTIINWCDSDYSYGVLVGSIMSEEEILVEFGLTKSDLDEYIDTANTMTEPVENTTDKNEDSEPTTIEEPQATTQSKLYGTLTNHLKLDLPDFKSELKTIELDGETIFRIEDTVVFVIVYEDASDDFKGEAEKQLENGLVIRYKEDNPFILGSTAYNDYKLFLDTIDDIADSIQYID